MRFSETGIAGVVLVDIEPREDERGGFAVAYKSIILDPLHAARRDPSHASPPAASASAAPSAACMRCVVSQS